MASSSPISEPESLLEENVEPSVSTTDGQTGKPTTKNKNTVNQKKTTPYEDPESVAPSGKTDADGKEESEVPISTDEQMKNEIDIDSTQPDSQQQQQGALDESSPGSDSPNNSDRGQHPLRSPIAASQDKGSQEHTASKNDPKEDGHTDIKSDDPVHEDEESVNDEVAKLLKENKELKKQVQTMQDEIYEKDADIKSYKKVIDKKEAEAESSNCRMKQLEQDLNKKDDEIESVKAVNIMLEDDVKKHAYYSEELEKKKQTLEEVHHANMETICSQQTEIENLRCEKDALTESYIKLKSEKDALTESYKKMKSDNDALNKSHEKLKSDKDALTRSNERLKRDISDTLKKTDATSKEHEKQIKQLKKDLGKEKEEHKADIQAKEKLLKKENEKHQKVVNDLQKQIQSFQNDCTKLREKNDRLSKIEQVYNVTSQRVKSLQSTLSDKEITINGQQRTIHSLQRSIDWYHNENESKHRMIASLEEEKETLLLRLSKITGAQLTYNNPNIADLSDDKRPTKLAEEFSELYDNEWTDAFECIEAENDDEKTQVLYDLLKKAYEFCKTLSTDHDKAIRKSFTTLNYTNSMSSGANEGVQSDASNEIRDLSPDKISENKDQSTLEVKNVTGDGGVEETKKTQEDTDSVIMDREKIMNEAERYENDQHEKTRGDLEKDENRNPSDKIIDKISEHNVQSSPEVKTDTGDGGVEETEKTQEDTDSVIMDNENVMNKAERYENDQHEKTRGDLEKDENTNPSDNAIDEISEHYVQSSPEVKTDTGDGEVEETENVIKTKLAQDDTDSGIMDREKNLNKAERYENDQHEKTPGSMEKDEHKNPSNQVIDSGDADGIKALDKSGVSGKEQSYVTALENGKVDYTDMQQKEVNMEERTIQTVHKFKDNEQDGSKIHVNTESDDYVHVSKEETIIYRRINDENISSAKHLKEGKDNFVDDKEQIKVSELTFNFDDLSAEQKKTIMDLRKLCEEKQTNDVVQVGSKLIATEMQIENGEIMKYISKCIDICWSMRRHTPPVYMDYSKSEEGLPFEKQKYRPYTKSGKFVHFVVWPVLYLHEGGPQLSKGVAQGKD